MEERDSNQVVSTAFGAVGGFEQQRALVEAAQEFYTKRVEAGAPLTPRKESDMEEKGSNQVVPAAALTAVVSIEQQRALGEVQAAMMLARANPRDERRALDRILLACARPSLAERAVYEYVRGGTNITGASIRLAEAIAQAWGNIQYGVRELSRDRENATAQAYAWDLETGTRRESVFTVPLVRHTREGSYRLEDPRDIYEMVANQAARRVRACILALIPSDVVEEAVAQCEATLKAKADTSPDSIRKMLDAFAALGVSKEQIERRIQRRIEAITPAQVVQLKKIYTSLRDGMSSVEDWFEPVVTAAAQPQEAAQQAPKGLAEKIRRSRKQAQPETGEPAPSGNGDGQDKAPEAPKKSASDDMFSGRAVAVDNTGRMLGAIDRRDYAIGELVEVHGVPHVVVSTAEHGNIVYVQRRGA